MTKPVRTPRGKFVEDSMQPFKKDEAENEELYLHIASNVSDSTSSAINLMKQSQQQTSGSTLQETIEAYEKF